MEKEKITEILASLLIEHEKERSVSVSAEERIPVTPELLKELLGKLHERNHFQIGDLVQWKDKLFKNRAYPSISQLAIVVDVLKEPVLDKEVQSGSPSFGVSYDLVLGVIINNTFHTFYYESQRFKKIEDDKSYE